ncbi:hypothetical protein [Microbulbifer sp. YPW1]|nr:hypothetical protein HUW35_03810 [Microbulbifer sp. YPW1]
MPRGSSRIRCARWQ